MPISAELIKELRERTGSGFLECKKALEENQNDIEKAIDAMRKTGQAKVAKKAGRIAAEGIILIRSTADAKLAVILEINCETDFVAKDAGFRAFADEAADTALKVKAQNVESLLATKMETSDKTINETLHDLIAKIGENIKVRRVVCLVAPDGIIATYLHGIRIGVLVHLSLANQELGKDLAMQIAATKPQAIDKNDLDPTIIAKEKEIFLEQAKTSGKPPTIMEKMFLGRIEKYFDEVVLVRQVFVKNPDMKVADLLKKNNNAKVFNFVRFEVGEGIEKKTEDFATEVAKQAKVISG